MSIVPRYTVHRKNGVTYIEVGAHVMALINRARARGGALWYRGHGIWDSLEAPLPKAISHGWICPDSQGVFWAEKRGIFKFDLFGNTEWRGGRRYKGGVPMRAKLMLDSKMQIFVRTYEKIPFEKLWQLPAILEKVRGDRVTTTDLAKLLGIKLPLTRGLAAWVGRAMYALAPAGWEHTQQWIDGKRTWCFVRNNFRRAGHRP